MDLGSVTLKRIGFFCFPIKHSTHTVTVALPGMGAGGGKKEEESNWPRHERPPRHAVLSREPPGSGSLEFESRAVQDSWRPENGGRRHRRPPRRRASPAPFFLADCGGLSVGWVSCRRDRRGGERVVGGVLPRINIGTWGLCDRLCLVLVCRVRCGLGGGFFSSFWDRVWAE
jgi:hypothetical protein